MADCTIFGSLLDALGNTYDFRRAKVWVIFNTQNGRITDELGQVRVGAGQATVTADGDLLVAGVPIPGASNPTTFQIKLCYAVPPKLARTRGVDVQSGDFGWMTVTGTSRTITNKALVGNVATVDTDEAHGLAVGHTVTIAGVDATFNGTYTITAVPSETKLSYAKVHADVASAASGGTLTSSFANLALLEDEQYAPPEYVTRLTGQLDAIRDDAQGYADDASGDADRAEAAQAATEANINGLGVGTVTTGAPGTPAEVVLTGTAPDRSFDFTIPAGPQGLPGPGSAAWAPTTAVTTGAVRQAPDGSWIKSTANRTTRGSFDATEEGFWTSVSADPTSVDGKALLASIAAAQTDIRAAAKVGQTWLDTAFAGPSADDTPTLSINTASQIAGGTTITPTSDYVGDAHFRYDGVASVAAASTSIGPPASPALGGTAYLAISTVLSSTSTVEFDFTTETATTAFVFRVSVNGKWVSVYGSQFTGLSTGTSYKLKLTFPTAKPRRVRVEVAQAKYFNGVIVPSGVTATRPAGDIVKRLVSVGDSYIAGANGASTTDPTTNGTQRHQTFAHYLAKALDCDSHIDMSIGGTGWVDSNVGADSTFGQRVPDILAANPHIVLLAGSVNDTSLSATFSDIYTAVTGVLAALVNVPVVILTGPERDAAASASYATFNDAVRLAAAAYGRIFVDTLDTIKGSLYNSADGLHPSAYAHFAVLAPKVYAGIDRTVVDAAVAAAVGGRASVDVTLTASPVGAATVGASVTLTATLSTARTGTVAFYDGTTLLGTGTVSGTTATLTTSALSEATHSLYAIFRPATPFLVKSSTSNTLSYVVSSNLGFTDTFTRADGPVGSTENGKVYTKSGGNGSWVVASNKLANPTESGGSTYCVADAGTPNGTLQVTIGGTGTTGLGAYVMVRYQTGTNMLRLLRASGSEITFQKVVSGTATTLAVSTGSSVWVAGDVISVVCSGNLVTVKKNGTNIPGLTNVDTGGQFATETKFGVGIAAAAGAGATFDDLSFVAA